jgi:hypothetical protein
MIDINHLSKSLILSTNLPLFQNFILGLIVRNHEEQSLKLLHFQTQI